MIIEHVLLSVRPDSTAAFETAFARARLIIESMPGFRALSLSRCVETAGTYLLLVEWDTLRDHVEGFRGSPEYARWSRLLHHFYDPFPVVSHYRRVAGSEGDTTAPRSSG